MNWQLLGLISGTALLSAAGLRALQAAFVGQRRVRRSQSASLRRRQAFDKQLQAGLQWARAAKPIFKAWTGTRQFSVTAVADEATDCKSYYLVPADGHPLPRYEPGQFLTFSLPIDPRQKPLVRCYSLSDRPREDYYRVTIKQAQPPRENPRAPLGLGSSFFHQRIGVGSTLDVQAPQGGFFLDPRDQRPVVLIGAGIGITPILSMANTLAEERSEQTAYVFVGFGNSSEHPFRKQMLELNAARENLHFDISYSRPMPSDQIGRDYDQRGYVDIGRLKQVLPSSNFQFYICGPAGLMQTLVPALREWGVPDGHIHFEAFGPASVKSIQKTGDVSTTDVGPCQVEFSRSAACLTWKGGHESLLDFAESGGVALDYGCRAGNCGQCVVTVQQGTVEHVKEPGLPLEANQCLTCIGVPRGDVVLEA